MPKPTVTKPSVQAAPDAATVGADAVFQGEAKPALKGEITDRQQAKLKSLGYTGEMPSGPGSKQGASDLIAKLISGNGRGPSKPELNGDLGKELPTPKPTVSKPTVKAVPDADIESPGASVAQENPAGAIQAIRATGAGFLESIRLLSAMPGLAGTIRNDPQLLAWATGWIKGENTIDEDDGSWRPEPEEEDTAKGISTRIKQLLRTSKGIGNVVLEAMDEMFIRGDLDLRDTYDLESLPKKLVVGSLNFGDMACLNLSGCKSLKRLPADLRVEGSLYLNDCGSLAALPDGLRVGGMVEYMGGEIWKGSLILQNCSSLRSLPNRLEIMSDLDLRGCSKWDGIIPSDIETEDPMGGSGRLFTDEFPEGIRFKEWKRIKG